MAIGTSSACLAVAGLPRQSSNYVSALIFSDLLVERLLLPSDREWWETDVGILEF
jgi:hypothetical protein